MDEKTKNKTKLGAFVLTAIAFLLIGLYYIGSKKNIFHSTITVSANFNNVGGLMPGNNVRFNGINIGTVTEVYSVSDTAIKVEFTIDKESTKFINQNSIASIGTDGLLGNKLVNIEPSLKGKQTVQDGDVFKSSNPIQMDNVMRKLTATNDNLEVITDNIKNMTGSFNDKNSLTGLFKDTVFAANIKSSIVNLKLMSNQAVLITGNLKGITDGIKNGKGTVGALLTDTILSSKIKQVVIKLQKFSDTAAIISGDISAIVKKLKQGKGTIGVLLNDTMIIHNLNKGILSLDSGAINFNEDMEALKYSWPFKKYFKKHSNLKKAP